MHTKCQINIISKKKRREKYFNARYPTKDLDNNIIFKKEEEKIFQ